MEPITEPVTLANLHGNVLAEGTWSAGARRNLGVETVEPLDSPHGPVSVLHHLRPEGDYLVHRGSLEDFGALHSDLPGRANAQLLSLELVTGEVGESGGSGEPRPVVDVAVVEYDAQGSKSSVAFHPSGGLRFHTVGADCTHFLIALRFRGAGRAPIRHFRVDAHEVPVLPDGREWMTRAAVAPVPGYVRDMLAEAARALPRSNGSRHHAPRPFSVALVGGDSMAEFYREAFHRVDRLTPDTFRQTLADRDHDLLLMVEDGAGGTTFGQPDWSAGQLDEILAHFHRTGRPTAFHLTTDADGPAEDLEIATRCDQLFTSNEDHLEAYRLVLGDDRVHHLPPGANPLRHHPLGAFRAPLGAVLTDGSYPDGASSAGTGTRADLETILDSVVASSLDLVVADDHFGDPDRAFPVRFRSHSTPAFDPEPASDVRKLFRHHVAVSTSKLSRSSWGGRIHELQAQGLSVVTNFARSVFNDFPHARLVSVAEDLSDLHDPATTGELATRLDGVRTVLGGHTVFDLADILLRAVGIEPEPDRGRVLVLADDLERARPMFDRQSYPDAVLRARAEFPTPESLDAFCAGEDIAYLAPWSAATDYGKDYLLDRINVFRFVDRDYATQLVEAADWALGEQPVHEYTETCGRRDRTVFSLAYRPASAWWTVEDGAGLANGYAADPLQVDFPVGRRFAPAADHVEAADQTAGEQEPLLTVILPVYNNGPFLLGTSLPSLRRQRIWPQIAVQLVDDGSSDEETLRICASLAEECPNISLYRFGDGGSGSASRPRNKGVELATTELVTFLDPDNEISPGGYDHLVRIHAEQRRAGRPVQFVGGYQVKVAEDARPMGRYGQGTRVVEDVRGEFFGVRRFPLISSQAAVMERSLFHEGGLDFVEGAAGEDTLFGWEVLLVADGVCLTDAAHLLYYAGRDGSVTNSLGAGFFRKHLILERERIQRLARHGILGDYRAKHFEHYMTHWYGPRLEQVKAEDREESRAIVREIDGMYRSVGPVADEG